MQTEGLLTQTQQRELQQTNEQLEQKAQQLEERNVEVEGKNQEIEQARRALEEKATELASASKYKSDFLANMSHELRTPLNSILILGQQLGENPDRNLTPKQVEFARTIHSAGTDLMNLISDILDLSKIESGTVTVDAEEVFFVTLQDTVVRPFRHEAENRHLSFDVQIDPKLDRSMVTDSKRLQQVLKNLLSNAFKFTEQGGVKLSIRPAIGGWTPDHPVLGSAPGVVYFESRTPASAFRRRNRKSSSKPFSRRIRAQTDGLAAPAWVWRSAASFQTCSAASFSCAACQALATPLRCICRSNMSPHRRQARGPPAPCRRPPQRAWRLRGWPICRSSN